MLVRLKKHKQLYNSYILGYLFFFFKNQDFLYKFLKFSLTHKFFFTLKNDLPLLKTNKKIFLNGKSYKNNVSIVKCFLNFNFTYYQQVKYVQSNNMGLVSQQLNFKNLGRSTNWNLLNFKIVLWNLQKFLDVLYGLFINNKTVYFFNNPNTQLSINAIYYNIFGFRFLNQQQYFILFKFEWLKFKKLNKKFIKFLKRNKISLLIFLDYELFNNSLNFLKYQPTPVFSLTGLNVKNDYLSYYLICDYKLLVNHFLVILWVFKMYTGAIKTKSLHFFFKYYRNFIKYSNFLSF